MMSEFPSPEAVVEAQLPAYHRKDVAAWLAIYEVQAGKTRFASFTTGQKTLD